MDIYVSKPGVMCAGGTSLEELWQSVVEGNQKGIKKVITCTGEEFFAAKIEDSALKASSARYDMRIMQIEEQALEQIESAINAAKAKYGKERIAVCIGSCDNGTEFSLAGHRQYFKNGEFPESYNIEIQGADYVSTFISEKYDLQGPCSTFSTACSSSAGAVIKGAEMIMAGIADAVVVGGIDIASDTVLLGFNSLETIDSNITNPISKNRHGITIGEAGAFFVLSKDVLEKSENSDEKSVKILGWGESADAYHMTSPDPSGEGAKVAMQRALDMAGLKACEVDYVNLHGTGTRFNDSMECIAVDKVFADYKVPVSTTKPITGHTLGAAAALELSVCYAALVDYSDKISNNVKLPVQKWDGEQDPQLPVLNVINTETAKNVKQVKVCMSNSFAFGGANASIIIGK